MPPKVVVHSKEATGAGPFRVDTVRLSLIDEGKPPREMTRVSLERGDAVAVLVHRTDTDEVILTRQFRYPAFANAREKSDGFLLELPAGFIDDGETPEAAGRREVEEEVGYVLDRLETIATFFVSPGGTSERVDLFYGAVHGGPTRAGGGLASEGEEIQVITVGADEFLARLARHEIRDAKTLIGGLWLQARRSA